MAKKTVVQNMDRGIYDIKNKDTFTYKSRHGISEEIILEISKNKNEPKWMTDFRLNSLKIYNSMQNPTWGPDISHLNMDEIITYVKPSTKMQEDWANIPKDINETFDILGIKSAEKESLAGVGAQYDSEVVYHKLSEDLLKQGVIYTDIETALNNHGDLVKEYFMQLVPPSDHKYAALHGAVWSGGSFVYVPKGVNVSLPLQSYFRLNSPGSGQFEHTLIILEEYASLHFIEGCSAPKYSVTNLHAGCVELFVKDRASLKYSTIENWSKNMLNLNTKRSIIGEDASITWVSGSFGSEVSMLYPMSILKGNRASCDFTGITFAGNGQTLDSGAKVVHIGEETTSNINAKGISKDGGTSVYRGCVTIGKDAINSKSIVSCDSLMLDNLSRSDTIPVIVTNNDSVDVGHEAKIGTISEESIFYLMTRGIDEAEARSMIVRGFVEPISKELPLEYAVEMNNLINLEFEGTIG
jgi:Fe-S cluster assembly protein SufB